MCSSLSAFGTVHALSPRSSPPASDLAQLCRRLKALARVRLREKGLDQSRGSSGVPQPFEVAGHR